MSTYLARKVEADLARESTTSITDTLRVNVLLQQKTYDECRAMLGRANRETDPLRRAARQSHAVKALNAARRQLWINQLCAERGQFCIVERDNSLRWV